MIWSVFFLISLFLIALEGSVVSMPLLLGWLICIALRGQEHRTLFLALVTGVVLDIVTFRMIGISSMFFIVYLFLILLYHRKFEIRSVPFVFIATCIGSLAYLMLFGRSDVVFQSFGNGLFASGLFGIMHISSRQRGLV